MQTEKKWLEQLLQSVRLIYEQLLHPSVTDLVSYFALSGDNYTSLVLVD